jgi:GntR family transcriptional repressor for pyruvate dehydrogenase complex
MVDHLIQGDWLEGDRIPPERELCQKLGVGRSSLREAMKALEIIGLIEMRVGEGTFICNRSDFLSHPLLWAVAGSGVTEANELIEARTLIEVELADLAAIRSTPNDLQQIGAYLDAMETSGGDTAQFMEADIAFHLAIGQAAHNRVLLNALHLIRNLMHQWVRTALERQAVAAQALEHHRAIFVAIAKRNPANARQAMHVHLDAMASYLRASQGELAASGVSTSSVRESRNREATAS